MNFEISDETSNKIKSSLKSLNDIQNKKWKAEKDLEKSFSKFCSAAFRHHDAKNVAVNWQDYDPYILINDRHFNKLYTYNNYLVGHGHGNFCVYKVVPIKKMFKTINSYERIFHCRYRNSEEISGIEIDMKYKNVFEEIYRSICEEIPGLLDIKMRIRMEETSAISTNMDF